jgi:hypothetical protein
VKLGDISENRDRWVCEIWSTNIKQSVNNFHMVFEDALDDFGSYAEQSSMLTTVIDNVGQNRSAGAD